MFPNADDFFILLLGIAGFCGFLLLELLVAVVLGFNDEEEE